MMPAQTWVDMMQQPGANFYDIQKSFNEYWKDKDITVSGNGYKPFKRWENYVEQRVYPSGDLSLLNHTWPNFMAFKPGTTAPGRLNHNSLIASSTWTAMGPMGPMQGLASNGFPRKAGRDNFITFHPTTPTTFWAGTPAGGLWKTTDDGVTWTTNTDNLSIIGCSDLAVASTNTNIMYLATGDGDAGDTPSMGILKSIDGGQTWAATSLTFALSQQRQIRRLIVNPLNHNTVFAATSVGIYRTLNGGTTWTSVNGNNTFDIEFKPGDTTTLYASGTAFFLSTNGGTSFTTISAGISTGANRMCIAVTPNDPTYVYLLASNSTSNGFLGLYRSVNSGAAFSLMSSTPDILANSCAGTAGGGQGWYDLALAVSPLDKNKVSVGGVNVWMSNSGGATGTWTCTGCWIGTTAPSVYLKADHHDLDYNPSGILYAATDGGVFKYNVSNWIDLNNQRNIAQMYKIGLSAISPNKWITGHQDNGSNIYTGTTYTASLAGDGMDCFIDRTNDLNMFASNPNGTLNRSTNGGSSWTGANSGISGTGGWVTPWKQDPTVATRLYAGFSQMFVSNNLGVSWTQLTATGGSGTIVEFAIAPSNNQVIYIIQGTSIRKTSDGGVTWTGLTGIPTSLGAPTFITVSPTDPNKVWVTLSGYSAANKVFQSVNGGTNWTNITYNLPNIPANCSVYQPGSSDLIYVGMDVGVYFKDINTNTWTLYNTGLPNVPVHDMEISPANPGKLRAATYGRGVYQVDVYQVTAPPVSNFTYTGTICSGTSKVFKDASNNSPSAWSWSVSPNTGVSFNASAQNPTVSFANAGIYTVAMTASNSIGLSNVSTKTITVLASPNISFSIPSNTVCVDEEVNISVSGAQNFTWSPGGLVGNTMTFTASVSQSFTVNAQDPNGCTDVDSLNIFVSKCDGIATIANLNNVFSTYPNPTTGKLNISAKTDKTLQVDIEVLDVSGKVVMKQSATFKRDKNDTSLNISGLAVGVYTVKLKTSDNKVQLLKVVRE
jgi:PKD repeat protein